MYRYLSALIPYPATWGGVLVVALAHAGFAWWFSPPPAMQVLAGFVDGLCLYLLVMILLRSAAFLAFYDHRQYPAASNTVATLLSNGMAAFRTAALASLHLSQQLHANFKDESSLHELAEFLRNIVTMAENHRTLYVRSQQFGTAEQKDTMRTLLARQLHAMQQTLESLQAFSGNLTLLSAQLEKSALAARELQFINQGLQEVIQEMADA